jgi:hypothetical protein
VIHRVIREIGGESSYSALIKTNYLNWTLLMKVKLTARALWSIIEDGGADQQEEMMALDALCGAVPPEMVPKIAKKDMTKKATTQQLRRKFDLATFNDNETVEDYVPHLSSMVAHLATLDKEVKDSEIVTKMLRSLPPRFKKIMIAIRHYSTCQQCLLQI